MSEDMAQFWKKKTIVTYLLSVLVFLIHISSFGQYGRVSTEAELVVNRILSALLSHSLTEASVPLFFIISGALFFRDYSNEVYIHKVRSRVQSLLIPYLVWNILALLFAVGTSYSFLSRFFVGRERFVINAKNVFLAIFHHKCNGPFWFIFNLFFFVLLAPVIDPIVSTKRVGVISILILMVLTHYNIGLPDTIFSYKSSVVYYVTGAYIGKHYFHWFSKRYTKKEIEISLILSFIGVIVFFAESLEIVALPTIVRIALLLLFSFSIWVACDLSTRYLRNFNFTKHSFFVYALHINVSAVIAKGLYYILPAKGSFAIVNYCLTVIGTLIFINVFCTFLEKHFKAFYIVLSGARNK